MHPDTTFVLLSPARFSEYEAENSLAANAFSEKKKIF